MVAQQVWSSPLNLLSYVVNSLFCELMLYYLSYLECWISDHRNWYFERTRARDDYYQEWIGVRLRECSPLIDIYVQISFTRSLVINLCHGPGSGEFVAFRVPKQVWHFDANFFQTHRDFRKKCPSFSQLRQVFSSSSHPVKCCSFFSVLKIFRQPVLAHQALEPLSVHKLSKPPWKLATDPTRYLLSWASNVRLAFVIKAASYSSSPELKGFKNDVYRKLG